MRDVKRERIFAVPECIHIFIFVFQLGYTVREVVAQDNSVTTTIVKDIFTQEDVGPFTVVVTNANSGTSRTVVVTTSPTANETEDVMTQTINRVIVQTQKRPMIKEITTMTEADNNNHTTEDVLDSTTPRLDKGTQQDFDYRNANLLGVFVAMFLFLVSVLFIYAIVRKRNRDVLYSRTGLPSNRTVFLQVKTVNYGTCKLQSV